MSTHVHAPLTLQHRVPENIRLLKESLQHERWRAYRNPIHVICVIKTVCVSQCERWIIKKAEHQRIDAFELWCWWRLLRVSWTARRLNQSILKEINSGYILEGLMLKLKLQYFGHLIRRVDSLEKNLMLRGTGGRRRRGRPRMRWMDGITDSMNEFEWTPGVGDGQGGLACCDSWGRKESGTTEWLNWTELNH